MGNIYAQRQGSSAIRAVNTIDLCTCVHQFHDELPGTSRAPVYRDNDTDYDRVQALMEGVLDDALAEIAARLDTRGEGVPIVVYNPLAWTRSEPVRLIVRLSEPPRRLVVRDACGKVLPT
jgi:alpha-mannosidase